jgi:hypothetical protein
MKKIRAKIADIQSLAHRFIKYVLSFRKKDWELHDYPIFVRHQEAGESTDRFKLIPWTVQIRHWFQMSGDGDSLEGAQKKLEAKFSEYKTNNPKLPRPGTSVPIEFASSEEIDKYPDLLDDFLRKILGFTSGPIFVSDQSSLWDFCVDENLNEYFDKILHVYHVDARDIEDANLVKILNKISEHKKL